MTQWISSGGWVMAPLLLMLFLTCFILIERTWFLHQQDFSMDQAEEASTPKIFRALEALSVEAMSEEAFDRSCQSMGQSWMIELEKRSHWLDFVITAAPLLGLLGTITGMMKSFQVLGHLQSTDMQSQITGGVAESLIATATGLGVALFALGGHFYLKGRRQHLEQRFEAWLLYFERQRRQSIK